MAGGAKARDVGTTMMAMDGEAKVGVEVVSGGRASSTNVLLDGS
jgi:uncharacterized 2Fe-2S/4Fe-4S cluster protein (DUF4445 family)